MFFVFLSKLTFLVFPLVAEKIVLKGYNFVMFASFFRRCCLEKTKSIASHENMKDLRFHFRK